MFKPGPDMLRGDRPERHTQRLDQAFEGAGLGRAQRLLGLGPTQLDRVEVGRVGRQVQHTRAAGFDGGDRFDIPMGRQVVHQQDIARVQDRRQDGLDVGGEDQSIHGPREHERGAHARQTDGRHRGVVLPRIAGCGFHHALAGARPAVQPGQAQMRPAFIEKIQPFQSGPQFRRDTLPKFPALALYARRLPLAVVETLFF